MKRTKPLICTRCGHKLGIVRIKPAFQKKLIGYGIGIAFLFEFVANIIIKLVGL